MPPAPVSVSCVHSRIDVRRRRLRSMVGGSPRNKARNADEEAQMHRCVICNKIIEEQRVLALLDMTGEAPEKCIDCAWGGNNPWNSNVDTTTCPSPKIKQPQPMETDAERGFVGRLRLRVPRSGGWCHVRGANPRYCTKILPSICGVFTVNMGKYHQY